MVGTPCVLGFCRIPRQCARVVEELEKGYDISDFQFKTKLCHGSMDMPERRANIRDGRSDKIRRIVGTDALAVGDSHPSLGVVVRNSIPDSPTACVQHVGHAVRDKEQSCTCLLFGWSAADATLWAAFSSRTYRDTGHTFTDLGVDANPIGEFEGRGFDLISSEAAAEDAASVWSEVELINQHILERPTFHSRLSESCLLFIRSEIGGCTSQQRARHGRAHSEWDQEQQCGRCNSCAQLRTRLTCALAKCASEGVNVDLFVEPFVELVRCFGFVGVEYQEASNMIRSHLLEHTSEIDERNANHLKRSRAKVRKTIKRAPWSCR